MYGPLNAFFFFRELCIDAMSVLGVCASLCLCVSGCVRVGVCASSSLFFPLLCAVLALNAACWPPRHLGRRLARSTSTLTHRASEKSAKTHTHTHANAYGCRCWCDFLIPLRVPFLLFSPFPRSLYSPPLRLLRSAYRRLHVRVRVCVCFERASVLCARALTLR